MKNRYPIISNREVLEPKVIIMPVGKTLPQHAIVYTQREYTFIQECKKGGMEVNVNLKKKL